MPHSHVSCLVHVVFSTKGRRKDISPELCERLPPYMAGIADNIGAPALAINCVQDHAHMLISLPSSMTISEAVRKIKASSSKWVHENFPGKGDFAWQTGYSAFSVGLSTKRRTIEYIEGQEEHHRKKSFKEELDEFLKAHGFSVDK